MRGSEEKDDRGGHLWLEGLEATLGVERKVDRSEMHPVFFPRWWVNENGGDPVG